MINLRFKVSLQQIHDKRPSGHKPSAGFGHGLDYTEEFYCEHAEDHAKFFIKIFDLSAFKCGMDKGEFQKNQEHYDAIVKLIADANALHDRIFTQPKQQTLKQQALIL